jgi:hypothetical protein
MGRIMPQRIEPELAYAWCRSCGIISADMEDAVAELLRANIRPPDKRLAEAARILKRRLARALGVPARSLPKDLLSLLAIGRYEAAREEIEADPDYKELVPQFDYHDRRFAIENGVCPRCGNRGDFASDRGYCNCGFAYTY